MSSDEKRRLRDYNELKFEGSNCVKKKILERESY